MWCLLRAFVLARAVKLAISSRRLLLLLLLLLDLELFLLLLALSLQGV